MEAARLVVNVQTIISLSDSKDPSKEIAVGINGNGTIFLNGRTDKGTSNFTKIKSGYNYGTWHTLVINIVINIVINLATNETLAHINYGHNRTCWNNYKKENLI